MACDTADMLNGFSISYIWVALFFTNARGCSVTPTRVRRKPGNYVSVMMRIQRAICANLCQSKADIT